MKKISSAIALAIATLGAAQAQTDAPAPEKQMRFLVGAGLTVGGDKLATVHYVNGDDIDIHAGGIFALTAGIDYRVTPEFSFQGTVGFHVDDSVAKNGSVKFQRFPIELLAYYHLSPNWRIGGGARYVTNAKLSSSGAADIGGFEFKNTLGGVVEAEYMFGQHGGVKVRYVKEEYEEKRFGDKFDGSHVGVFGTYYF